MAEYRFSYTERYALWRAYDGRCFHCEKPLDFQDMTVDHIIPEWLTGHPCELRKLREDYEIDANFPGFQVNDFSNWVPAHSRCNTRKGKEILSKKIALLLLNEVQGHLAKVRGEQDALSQNRANTRVLGPLSAAIENKRLNVQEVHRFVAQVERSLHADEPLVLTFGLRTDDVLQNKDFPPDAPRDYPYLCDWLELDLVKHLRRIVSTPFHYTQPSDRTGETLSVRMVFPGLNDAELDRFDSSWWEILEAANFWDIFGETYCETFSEPPEKEYFGDLEGS